MQINLHVFKCPPLVHMHAFSHRCHWSMDALFNAVPNIYLHN